MEKSCILIRTRQYVERVPVDEILSIERDGRRIIVVLDGKEHIFSGNMEDIAPYLNENFLKCHSGCYVNMEKIRRFKDQFVVFFNGYTLYLGRTNFLKAKSFYINYYSADKKTV